MKTFLLLIILMVSLASAGTKYKDGTECGCDSVEVVLDSEGRIEHEVALVGGVMSGYSYHYYPEGSIAVKILYSGGEEVHVWWLDKEGYMFSESYTDSYGLRHSKDYYRGGTLSYYVIGRGDSSYVSQYFDSLGNLSSRTYHVGDSLWSSETEIFYPNGKVKDKYSEKKHYRGSKLVGPFIYGDRFEYYESGNLKSVTPYGKEGSPRGIQITYNDDTTKTIFKRTPLKGWRADGTEFRYKGNGEILYEVLFKNDSIVSVVNRRDSVTVWSKGTLDKHGNCRVLEKTEKGKWVETYYGLPKGDIFTCSEAYID